MVTDLTSFDLYFSFTTNKTIDYQYVDTLFRSDLGVQFSIFKVEAWVTSETYGWIRLITDSDLEIMPIYTGYITQENISMDFALQFGLHNKLLDAFTGNSSTDTSSDNLEDSASDFQTASESLFSYEDDMNDDLNDALSDINVNFNVGTQLGSKFLTSASWVRNQFDSITNNTPIGTVLSFSLILGLSLLLIGKAIR